MYLVHMYILTVLTVDISGNASLKMHCKTSGYTEWFNNVRLFGSVCKILRMKISC